MNDSTPICRCRVLYLGSAVPRQSKDGLQGIQEPLRSLYPSEGAIGAKGIDSWLSVWSNGILLENVDENLKQITRFFPIESLHYCAAVRQVLIAERGNSNPEPKFLPLDSPFARMPRAQHPPIFAAILRRTTGIKVLECHVFICKREAAANALVRCCFHAYADNSYARQLETVSAGDGPVSSIYGTLKSVVGSKSNGDLPSIGISNGNHHNHLPTSNTQSGWRSRTGSISTLNSVRHVNGGDISNSATEGYTTVKNFYGSSADLNVIGDDGEASIFNGDENHKVWNGSQDQLDSIGLESPYEMFSGTNSTLGRPVRARQISTPIEVQPPPIKEDSSRKKKDKKLIKASGSQSLTGTLIRPKPIHSSILQRPVMSQVPPPNAHGQFVGNPPFLRYCHTISHRGLAPRRMGPIMQHSGIQHPQVLQQPPHIGIPMQIPVMMQQEYATLQPSRSTKKKKKDKKNCGIPVSMPIVPPLYAYHPVQPAVTQSLLGETRPLAMSNRKLAVSVGNGLDDSGNSGTESPEGTGIYRRKGHLNERAFSYSIRQEHRSRSHGSLASLQFNPPDMKKEREIAQMIAGLNLNEDPVALQRNQTTMSNNPTKHQAIYSNSPAVIYGSNGVGPSSNFGKPRR